MAEHYLCRHWVQRLAGLYGRLGAGAHVLGKHDYERGSHG